MYERISGYIIRTLSERKRVKYVFNSYTCLLYTSTQICEFMSDKYKYIDKDVLVASAMLHDVGKLWELSDFPLNDYTDDGQLLGHIYIGAELVEKTANNIQGFPDRLKTLIKHCICLLYTSQEFTKVHVTV